MRKILNFFLCLLKDNCEYSIKKFLAYGFSGLVFYMIIFTDKQYYDVIVFLAVLLGIRSYERLQNKAPKI